MNPSARRPALALFALALIPAPLPADEPLPAANLQYIVDHGLSWLASQQRADGAFSENSAITSLAVLSFLARGNVPGQGPYGDHINRGIDAVLRSQQPDGMLSAVSGNQSMYDHGISTIMLCECYGMAEEPRRKKIQIALSRALRLIIDAQRIPKNPDDAGGWRYAPNSSDSDLSVTGWQLMALRAAANNGAAPDIPKATIDSAIAYIRRRASPSGGFTYSQGAAPTSTRTGIGILSLTLLGQHDSPEVLRGGEYLLTHPLNPRTDSYFFYGAYYCSQAANQLGGSYMKTVYAPIAKSLIDMQKQDGSWVPAGNEGNVGNSGNIYATSLALLALSIPYRALPMYQH